MLRYFTLRTVQHLWSKVYLNTVSDARCRDPANFAERAPKYLTHYMSGIRLQL